MIKIFIGLLLILVFPFSVYGQVLTLNSPETLAVPTASQLHLKHISIDVTNKMLSVTYSFMDANGKEIPKDSGDPNRVWECRDADGSTCFTDTFSFAIRSQDVGVHIGKGLRALIWSKMRSSVLTGDNNATLP